MGIVGAVALDAIGGTEHSEDGDLEDIFVLAECGLFNFFGSSADAFDDILEGAESDVGAFGNSFYHPVSVFRVDFEIEFILDAFSLVEDFFETRDYFDLFFLSIEDNEVGFLFFSPVDMFHVFLILHIRIK